MARRSTLLLLPLPPPQAGPEAIAEGLVRELARSGIEGYRVLNSSIRKVNRARGRLDLGGILGFLRVYARFVPAILGAGSLFMYMCSSRVGFLRDSVFILTARLLGRPVVAQYHGGNFHNFFRARSGLYKAFIRFVLGRLTRLLVVGPGLERMFDGIVPPGSVGVLVNGVDPSAFPERPVRGPGRFTVLFMGHLTYPKGFYDLALAWKLVKSSPAGKELSLVFAGERVGRKPALSVFLDAHHAGRFLSGIDSITGTIEAFIDGAAGFDAQYLGVIGPEERLAALHGADAFVLPSYTEGLSMSCIEAMSSGLPVIATPVGAMQEIVIEGRGGMIVPVGDHATLASAIMTLAQDRDRAAEMGRFNRQTVEQKLSIRAVAERLDEIMRSVAGPERDSRGSRDA